jgi:hypothetical protein
LLFLNFDSAQSAGGNGNGSLIGRSAGELHTAEQSTNGGGASINAAGPYTLGKFSTNGTGARAGVGIVLDEVIASPADTPTPSPTETPTVTLTPTSTPSLTATNSATGTPIPTSTLTPTNTASRTAMIVPTSTSTSEPSQTFTPTATATATATATLTQTVEPTPTPTDTCDVVDEDFDLVVDGTINAKDMLIFLAQIRSGSATADFNCDNSVDSLDLYLLSQKWTASLEP